MNPKTRKLTLMAMFAALAYVVMVVTRIPVVAAAPYLKYDPKDVIIVICSFVLGPLPGAAVSVLVTLLELVTVSTSGPYGFIMNCVASLSFVLPAAFIYRSRRTAKGALIGLAFSTALLTVMMLLWNYFITPLYQGIPRESVAAMLLPVFLPFNLVKGSLNAALTLLIYKPISNTLRCTGFLPKKDNDSANGRPMRSVYVTGAVVLLICVVAILFLRGVL